MKSTSGFSLASAICVVSIGLLAVLTVATSASVNQQLLLRNENTQIAANLAESAVQQALAELMNKPTWGSNPATDFVEFNGPMADSGVLLTFDRSRGVPFGVNNQTGSNPQSAWPGSKILSLAQVPAERVHVVAVAHCRNVTRTKEAIIYVPNFAVSLAATGKVHLHHSIAGSLKDPADLARLDSDPSLLGPGDLATNCNLSDSVVLESNSKVAGNLQSRGDVRVEAGSLVGGEVRRFYESTTMPAFQFDEYDPKRGDVLNYRDVPTGLQPAGTFNGLARCDGSVVIDGDLVLDDCLFFVTGDLTVKGGLRGSGAVVVKGKTQVEGGANLASDESVALLSRGDVRLLGTSGNSYTFQGLVYTRGNFTARYFTVLGGFVADGEAGNGNVDLHESRFLQNNQSIKVDLFHPIELVLQLAAPTAIYTPGVPDTFEGKLLTTDPLYRTVTNPPTLEDPPNVVSVRYSPASGQQTPAAPNPHLYKNPGLAARFNNVPDGDGQWQWWSPVEVEIHREVVNGTSQLTYYLQYTENATFHTQRYLTRDALLNAIADLQEAKTRAYTNEINEGQNGAAAPEESRINRIAAHKALLEGWEQKNLISNGATTANFTFDANRFLQQKDKVRISATIDY